MEDEEELERERRRKTRDPSVSGDPEDEDGVASERRSDNALACGLVCSFMAKCWRPNTHELLLDHADAETLNVVKFEGCNAMK